MRDKETKKIFEEEWVYHKGFDLSNFNFGISKLEISTIQGTQSTIYDAYNKDGDRLPILVKEIYCDKKRLETLVKAQTLASIYGIAPKLYGVMQQKSDKNKVRIIMEFLQDVQTLSAYVKKLDGANFDDDIRDQLNTKIKLLRKLKIQHHDIHSENVLISKNTIYIIDYDDVNYPIDNIAEIETIEVGIKEMILNIDKLPILKEKLKKRKKNLLESGISTAIEFAKGIDIETYFI